MAQRVGRGIVLHFHDRGTRRRWVVSSTPRPHFTRGKDPVPILQEAGWVPGPVWTGRKSRPNRDSIPDCPARSQSLYRLSYPTHDLDLIQNKFLVSIMFFEWQFSVDLGSTADGPMILCISVFMFKALTPCRHAELGSIFALNLCAFKGSLMKYSSFAISDALQTKCCKATPVAYRLCLSPYLCIDVV